MTKTAKNSKRVETVLMENIRLEGRNFIQADEVTTTWEITRGKDGILTSKREIEKKVKAMSFPLEEITLTELEALRGTRTPSFVLKENGKFFYAKIPRHMNVMGTKLTGEHVCGTNVCKRLSALSDEAGGCQRIRDKKMRIEKYPWITVGYETFNTKNIAFVVGSCEHYVMTLPRKKTKAETIKTAKSYFLND